ncbi:GAF domain-containing protein [Xylanimonas allomyrinae]|uniref:GAF domain-containing protein n=1 Tax=Xylanimonas allomyrinae TaxID=2509459 RepID=A0A4P6EJQ6_9MICO|nr:helix-turn-helix domain-containing protein [Xylanimonas allomyrinae]QAY62595.1 GAF domain-containing protein [Xylanimonas allomyrinae]
MPNPESRLLRVAAARADFLAGGREGAAGVPDLVAASWERSQSAGVDVTQPSTDYDDVDPASLLVRCALPVLHRIEVDAADVPLVIALTDQRARIVQRIDSSAAVGRLLDRVDFAPGYNYAESSMGTNGVGTVFEAGRALAVVGPEHFTDNLQPFACAGAPIIDPVTGRVEGVLDITCLAQTWTPIMHALVKSAAADIGRNLLMDRSQAQQAIFETFVRTAARSAQQAVFAFGGNVFMANPRAQELFDADEQRILRDHSAFLVAHRSRASDDVALPDGRRVHLRGTRIVADTEVAGLVVVAEVATRRSPHATDFAERVLPQVAVATPQTSELAGGLSRPHGTIATGQCPAWQRACAELREQLTDRVPTLVLGESGSGKFSLVVEMFQDVHPTGRAVSVDADELGGQASLDSLLGGDEELTLLIARNIDQAGTAAVENIGQAFTAVRERADHVWFVATLSDSALDSDLPFHALLRHFDAAVTVPPLRTRTADLPHIVASVLREIAPDRGVRISPDAQRVVARYTWPRNVAQLRDALAHALRLRPVGELQAHDLPAYCQTTARRTLTPLETAERDTIVEALRAHDGNRVAASQHLGMSRSSLYRKLEAFGINV